MNFRHQRVTLLSTVLLTACAAPQVPLAPSYKPSYSAPQPKSFPDLTHQYEVLVLDSTEQPVQGATLSFVATNKGVPGPKNSECITSTNGTCKLELLVSQDPSYAKFFESYGSELNYSASKSGYYTNSGTLSSSFGSKHSYTKEMPTKGTLTLYRPADYITEAFANSASDRELREQALKFMSQIRLQSLMVDADVMLRGMGTSSFKSKKYFQIKINTTTTYNTLKLDKYSVGKRLFDDSIRKILNPLNENISNPKAFFGYDLTIFGYMKNFTEKVASPEKVEYRFLIPQDVVRRYKDKDISGQQLLDASVILMNDERIELKLQ